MDLDPPRSRKRRHPESLDAPNTKSSSQTLELVEHPNFEELARWNPLFLKAWNDTRQHQKETGKSFSACVNQAFTVALTRATLQTHFDLRLPYLEENHLCPPVPNRFFYLHWIHSHLLRMHESENSSTSNGIDIGSGASCIYSLLAAKFFGCHMLTTEIDREAANMAVSNVSANNLQSQIQVCTVTPSHSQDSTTPPGGPVQRALEAYSKSSERMLDFVMTNPPFYDPSSMEIERPRTGDGRARTCMTVSEGNYPGGEVGFVTEMIADSLMARHTSRWFSSMLGKKTSLVKLQKLLTHLFGPTHVEVTEYGPGQYTRWFIAWTFGRPRATGSMKSLVSHDTNTFEVSLVEEKITTPQEAVSEVVNRIASFCGSSPGGWSVESKPIHTSIHPHPAATLVIRESNPPPISLFVDEHDTGLTIPACIQAALKHHDNSSFLPEEGHFVLKLLVEAPQGPTSVVVCLEGHAHSSRGLSAVKKLCTTLPGEVGRTNRKWRRMRQRMSQEKEFGNFKS